MLRSILKWLVIIILTPFLLIAAVRLNHFLVSYAVRNDIYRSVDEIPYRKYALVLGAGDYEPELWKNPAFDQRMDAVRALYFRGKISVIIASGIRASVTYDEPEEMKSYLEKMGIPGTHIIKDTLGIRTWISIQRLKDRFGIDSVTIVTQPVHVERAVFSAHCMGIEAIGFEAGIAHINLRFWNLRDRLSRVKTLFDCIAYHLKMY